MSGYGMGVAKFWEIFEKSQQCRGKIYLDKKCKSSFISGIVMKYN